MKTLTRFIFKSYLPPFAMTFVISVFILFMQFLWKWVDELVGKGLDSQVIGELFFYAALSMVPLALPMSVLLSSLMTFGNLAEHYELAALKSSGLSLMRIMRPLIIFSVVVSIGAFLFSDYVLPYTNLQMLSTLFDIRQKKPELNIPPGVFYNEIDGYTIRIKNRSKDGHGLEGIMIYDQTEGQGNTSLTVAESGKMITTPDKHYLLIQLYNGETYKDIVDEQNAGVKHPFTRMSFKDQEIRLDLSGFQMIHTQKDLFKENQQMLNGKQLLAYIDTMKTEIYNDKKGFYEGMTDAWLTKTKKYWHDMDSLEKANVIPPSKILTGNFLDEFDKVSRVKIYDMALNSARNCKSSAESKKNEIDDEEKSVMRFKIEFWRKYSYSLACLIMFFIGAPLGAIIRKGGLGMPVVVSVIFFILFWVLSITGEKLSQSGALPPEIGMWMGCVVFLPLGIWLTRKATEDSALFDRDIKFLSVIISFFRRRDRQLLEAMGTSPAENNDGDPPAS